MPGIPQDRYLLRRIVGCRALVHPLTRPHLYAWRHLAELLRADHKAIQRWHAEGIRIIIFAFRRQAAEDKPARAIGDSGSSLLMVMRPAGVPLRLTGLGRPGTSAGLLKETLPP